MLYYFIRKKPRLPQKIEMKLNQEDKRRFPRIKLKTPIYYRVRGKQEFNHSLTEDISEGGVALTNEGYIAPFTNLMLEIRILSQILAPVGRVAWASPIAHSNRYRVGVEFMQLEPQKTDYLREYIELQRNNL